MKTLLTGASGFIGRHLLAHLKQSAPDDAFFTVGRSPSPAPGITHFQLDLTDAAALSAVVKKVAPDRVFHLAGGSRVAHEIPVPSYFESNFLTTARLVEAIEALTTPPRLFFASSVHVYGNQEGTVTEESPPAPINPYGFSKYLAEEALRRFCSSSPDARVCVARLYSCIGPGQGEGFVVADLCRRLAKLPEGTAGTLETGPLTAFRRFVDIRDAVRFFPRLLDQATPGLQIFNLASPHELGIAQVVASLLSVSGKAPRVESSPAKSANPFLGLKISLKKLQSTLPDLPFRPIEETLRDTYEWARRETASEA